MLSSNSLREIKPWSDILYVSFWKNNCSFSVTKLIIFSRLLKDKKLLWFKEPWANIGIGILYFENFISFPKFESVDWFNIGGDLKIVEETPRFDDSAWMSSSHNFFAFPYEEVGFSDACSL